ncbi:MULTISPECIES: type-F conjugative transfer system protein TraW [Legionella]|uniref:type-F conjugative transfer system protein TraW n=1 Tax=Legionella TaxID=445 RepID=UPI000E203B87|nr:MULTISPECIES: type-F conjugative transfer system protein TraW [Legionella]QIN34144.1 type-F conjugative transfer system protein TraW [Legionella longbeachae]HBD7399104.1 type-F conjugative transfer system protein TraW [Legionella pneumophila]
MKNLAGLVAALLMNITPVYAKNLGNYGQLFPVVEKDIREVIMAKLHRLEQSGALKQHQQKIVARVEDHLRRPKPLHLPTTTTPKTHELDPSIVVNQTLYAHDGTLIAKKGAHLNPFERVSFSKTLFFFDADDRKQLAWVKTHYTHFDQVKFILTGGDVKAASEVLGSVYFDLEGRLSRYFHLKHVPSVVSQEGLVWRIQEIGQHELRK